jgi:hypothetical protein
MSTVNLAHEVVAQDGAAFYETTLRAQVEIPENIGKIIAIDPATGDYEIGEDLLQTSLKLKAKHPEALLWAEKIGFNAVYAVGGTLTRRES